jgi:hypothetical protein
MRQTLLQCIAIVTVFSSAAHADPAKQSIMDYSSVLEAAAHSGDLTDVRRLFASPDIDINGVEKNQNLNLLNTCLGQKWMQICLEALKDPDLDVNAAPRGDGQKKLNNEHPLVLAINRENDAVTKALLTHPELNPNAYTSDWTTPIGSLFKKYQKSDYARFRELALLIIHHPKFAPNLANDTSAYSFTPLHAAIREDMPEVVTALLALPNTQVTHFAMLAYALDERPQYVDALFSHPTLDVNQKSPIHEYLKGVGRDGNLPYRDQRYGRFTYEKCSPLVLVLQRKREELAWKMIQKPGFDANAICVSDSGKKPSETLLMSLAFHWVSPELFAQAAARPQVDVLANIQVSRYDYQDALSWAVHSSRPDYAKAILDRGDAPWASGIGLNALTHGLGDAIWQTCRSNLADIEAKNLALLKLILAIDPAVVSKIMRADQMNGMNALQLCAYTAPERAPLEALLGAPGADVNSADPRTGRTALHLVAGASQWSYVDSLQMLVKWPGIDVNQPDLEGMRAVGAASDKGLDVLLQVPGIDVNPVDARGNPLLTTKFLHLNRQWPYWRDWDGFLKDIKALARHPDFDVNSRGGTGLSFLHYYVIHFSGDAPDPAFGKLLKLPKMDLNSRDAQDRTILSTAIALGKDEFVKQLRDAGAKP